jgi:hypothetical protein
MGLVAVAAVQSRYGGQTNTVFLKHVVCSYTAPHRSYSGGTVVSEIKEFPKLYSRMAWSVLLV